MIATSDGCIFDLSEFVAFQGWVSGGPMMVQPVAVSRSHFRQVQGGLVKGELADGVEFGYGWFRMISTG